MRINWKKTVIVTLDVILGGYLIVAFTSFDKPNVVKTVCNEVNINIQDEATSGFITAPEIKHRLERRNMYPLSKLMQDINTRAIEDALEQSPFVQQAECYKTIDGKVTISLTQRMPTLRIKAVNGEDYYIDDNHSVMPNSHYTSDLIIVTGHTDKQFAQKYVSYLAENIMGSEFWKNQIVQINVLPNRGIELVPRVGEHIIYIGRLPETKYVSMRPKLIKEYVDTKLDRLEKFYRYGLSQAGWNKYTYINIEFDNQIICKKEHSNRK